MENETAANPAGEGIVTLADAGNDAPQTEANTPAEGVTDDLDALTKEALGETDASPEFVEVEIDGRKYKIAAGDDQPLDPELKFGAMREADYRKKTMTLAEERRALQEERKAEQARANLEGDALVRAQDLTGLETRIRNLSQVSVDDLRRQGWTEQQIREASSELVAMQRQRDALARQVEQDIAQFGEMTATQLKQAREKAIQQAGLADKALTPERCAQLEEFAISAGVDADDVRHITDPTAYRLLHLADIGAKFIERQRSAAQMKAAGAGKPSANVGGTAGPNSNPADMSPGEYIDWVKRRDAAA